MRFVLRLFCVLFLFVFPAFSVPPGDHAPAGSTASVRLIDYVNTEQHPVGYTFRGIVEKPLILDGSKTVIPAKSIVLLRLIADPDTPGGLTLDWWAVKFGEEWSEFRSTDGSEGAFAALKNVEDKRPPTPDARPAVSRGASLFIPSGSALHFRLRKAVRLLDVGRYRM
ncbi:MAG TPA: hypothetical protein VE621_07220 [Bryobacteraceae bacterium]|nr:hypothetical protein [Bryobacteraceae bacterium]